LDLDGLGRGLEMREEKGNGSTEIGEEGTSWGTKRATDRGGSTGKR